MPREIAAFGEGSVIAPPVTMLCPERVEIGAGVLIMESCHFSIFEEHHGRRHTPRLRIGDGSVIGPRTWFSCVGEIAIGERVLIGPGVLIADAHHEHAARDVPILDQPMMEPRPVTIAGGAYIGPGAAILSGVTVGEGAYVMPGSVVFDDVPAHAVVAGNPAAIVRRREADGRWSNSPDERWRSLLEALGEQS